MVVVKWVFKQVVKCVFEVLGDLGDGRCGMFCCC